MIKKIVCLIVICLLLSSCAYYKNTLLRIKADKISMESPIPEIPKIDGERVNAIFDRNVYLGSDKDIPGLSDIDISEKSGDIEDKVVITNKD